MVSKGGGFALPRWRMARVVPCLGIIGIMGCTTCAFLGKRRAVVDRFDPACVILEEEHARYPCVALSGFDAVVKNYYVDHRRTCGSLTEGGEAADSFIEMARRWRSAFAALFSNETNHPSRAADCGNIHEEKTLRRVRISTNDAHAPQPRASNPESTLQTSSSFPEPAPAAVLASSLWPPGTQKFSALVLEPSRSSASSHSAGSSATTSESEGVEGLRKHLRDPLRWFADRATQQSLVRCLPYSTNHALNCDGDPDYLGASYLRVMLTAFALLPASIPAMNVGIIGVGGGSLPNYLQRHFSSRLQRLDLVDVEPMCFTAAMKDMGLKETLNAKSGASDEAVFFHAVDGHSFLASSVQALATEGGRPEAQPFHGTVVAQGGDRRLQRTQDGVHQPASSSRGRPYDVLFVDAFIGSEMPSSVASEEFLRLCRQSLAPHGVAAFNLPGPDRELIRRCTGVFGEANVFSLSCGTSSNVVVLVRNARRHGVGELHVARRHLYQRAKRLSEDYRLPYDVSRHFPWWWRVW